MTSPSATEPCDLGAVEARRLIGAKALSPVELLESCLKRIDAVDGALNAVVTRDDDASMAAARMAEAAVASGEALGALHGLPIALKDNRATKGMRTTNASLLYKDHVPDHDDPCVARLRAAGAILFAKTNMPEFGAGANTTNRLFGATGNPFDPDKTCGGSSGGSAVALATGMAPLATGSDYGGSLRTPASFCGVAGFRPSMGVAPAIKDGSLLSPWGVNGPMGRTIADAHLLLSVQAAHDMRDPFSDTASAAVGAPIDHVDLSALKVAASADLGCCPVDAAIAETFGERTAAFSDLFSRLDQTHPDMGDIHDVFEVTRGLSFVSAHGEHVKTQRDQLDRNVIDNTERGLTYSLADVARAHNEQARLYHRWLAFFERYDALILPAAAVSPFPHDQLFVEEINGDAMPTYMRWLALSYAPTMAFATAAAVPCGVDSLGMPFGLQIAGPRGADRKVLAIAHALEQAFATRPTLARPTPDLNALRRAVR